MKEENFLNDNLGGIILLYCNIHYVNNAEQSCSLV